MKRKSLFLKLLAIFILCVGFVSLHTQTSHALTEDPGYFTGANITLPGYFVSEHDVLNSRQVNSTNSIPAYVYDGSNDKQDFINWVDGLVRQNSAASTWNELGGAFIVNTITRQASPNMNVSTAMFDDFRSRVLNPNVSMALESADPNSYCPASLNGGTGCKISFFGNSRGFDDLFATYGSARKTNLLVFRDTSNTVLYVLEIPCANPVGDLPGLPRGDNAPTVSATANCIGRTITARATDPDYGGSLRVELRNAAGTLLGSGNTNTANDSYTFAVSGTAMITSTQTYTVTVLGVNIAGTRTGLNDSTGVSMGPCNVVTCTNHTLGKTMLVNAPGSFTVQVRLDAWGSTYSQGNPALNVQVRDPLGVLVLNNPNLNYSRSGSGPVLLTSSPITFTPTMSGIYQMQWGLTGQGLDTFCPDGNNGNWANPIVTNAGYRPYFAVTGGDIFSGGGIRSWNFDGTGGNYTGAGTTLAAIAHGSIESFVTGGSLSGGVAAKSGSGLAFTNNAAAPPNYGGGYNVSPFTTTVSGPTQTLVRPSGVLNLADNGLVDNTTYTYTGDLQLFGTLPTGKNITLVLTSGNAIIQGDTLYGGYTTTSQVPRLTLIVEDGDIYVGRGVREMHGVYSASGTFFSCANGRTPVSMTTVTAYDSCKTKLTVYGAVAANTLVLSRTQGSLVASSGVPVAPAEEFIYSPELWLAEGNDTVGPTNVTYDSFVSLPPIL